MLLELLLPPGIVLDLPDISGVLDFLGGVDEVLSFLVLLAEVFLSFGLGCLLDFTLVVFNALTEFSD